MRSLRLALVGLGLAGFAAGSSVSDRASQRPSRRSPGWRRRPHPADWLVVHRYRAVCVVAAARQQLRRPDDAVGFVWFLSALLASDVPRLFAIGGLFSALPYAVLLHMLLAFPSGRLQTGWERGLIGVAYFDTTVMQVLGLSFSSPAPLTSARAAREPALDQRQPGLADAIFGLQSLIGVLGVTAIAILLVRRWRRASSAYRSALTPVLALAWPPLPAGHQLARRPHRVPRRNGRGCRRRSRRDAMASVPFAFLAGLLSSRLSRAAAVSEMVARLGEADRRQGLRDALAEALGDPSLSLAYWVPDQRSLRRRRPATPSSCLPRAGDSVCTDVEHEGRPVAMIRHDASLDADPELVARRGRCRRPDARKRAAECRAARAGRGAARLAGADRPRPPTTSAAASSATSMTAPSSGSSRWR